MTQISLEDRGSDCVREAAYDMDKLDLETLRERAQEGANESADNACIYTHHCYEIIASYENDDRAKYAEDLSGGETFAAEDWQKAMTAWAYNIAITVIESDTQTALIELEEAADELIKVLDERDHLLPEDGAWIGPEDLRLSRECPHGWAPHDKEDAAGVHYWLPGELEGCHAVAIQSNGLWLSYTWTAKAAAEA